jgi:uncharacterized membrane protein
MLGSAQLGGGLSDSTQGVVYTDEGRAMNLATDYIGIRWMQDNIRGTPTIVEGSATEYRWGARYSIYTGLPTVIGWSWHVRQHNSLLPGEIVDRRIEGVNTFYNTTDVQVAETFLQRYQVDYVIVGSMERVYYSADGLAKFQQMVEQGKLQVAFSDPRYDGITIYKVPR